MPTPSPGDLDARIWPRVVEAVRRAEPGLVAQVSAALEAKVVERTASLEAQVSALQAQLAQVLEKVTLLEMQSGNAAAAPPTAGSTSEETAAAIASSETFKAALDKRFKTMTERLLVYIEKDIVPRALGK